MADVTAAESVSQGTGKPPSKADEKSLTTMRKRMKTAIDATSVSREDELDDLKFRAASPDNPEWQWPAEVLSTRGATAGQSINARPTLVINKLPQHVLQVTNDQKQNRPAGRVIPVDDKADVKMAEIFEGMVRHIEYISDADVAYDTACDNQVTYGEGYFRILTDYCDETSFEQDIKIGRVRNSFSVYMDPTIQDPCGSDAQWCFITQEITKDEYEQQFPKASPISSLERGTGDDDFLNWITEDTIRIAEYFYFENEVKTLCMYRTVDGRLVNAIKGSDADKAAIKLGLKCEKTRETTIKMVKWCKTNGYEFLEKKDWAGRWIPVVRVIGNEFEIDGEIHVSGIVRNAKDAQRMYNYWVSQEAEMLALAPKAPFVGYAGQFEGFEQQWKMANVQNWPYLEVNPDAADPDGKPYPLPQRMQPPLAQNGLIQAKMGASDDIKATTGQYDPSLGAKSNETSGKAIIAREQQSDTGTYHYVDNLARAIRYGARQIVDLIPKIYDTKRIARIVGLDGETEHVDIDPEQSTPVQEIRDPGTQAIIKRIYNPKIGKYDVAVTTGPSYMTKRQQAADAQAQLLQGNPELWKVAGDLFVKNLDWPGAEELSKRLARIVPPEIRDDQDESPEMAQAKQIIQGLQQQVEGMGKAMEQMQHGIEAQTVEVKEFEAMVKGFDAETKRMQAVSAQLTPEQVQDMIMGTLHGMITSGDLMQAMPDRGGEEIIEGEMRPQIPQMPQMPQGMPMQQPPGGAM